MSEIMQALESRAQAHGTAQEAEPVVDMRSARLLAVTGKSDSSLLPSATVTASYLELGDAKDIQDDKYDLDTDNDEGLDVKGLLTQLLTFPRPKDGIVPDSWGTDKRSEIKRISTDMDSVYTLDSRVRGFVDEIRQDFLEIRKSRST